MNEAGQEMVDNDSEKSPSLDISHTTIPNLHIYREHFIYQFVLLPYYLLFRERASEQPVIIPMYSISFLSSTCITKRLAWIGQPSTFSAFSYTPGGGGDGGGFDLALIFRPTGILYRPHLCVSLGDMVALLFCKSLSTAPWGTSNSHAMWKRVFRAKGGMGGTVHVEYYGSKQSTYFVKFEELSKASHISHGFSLPSRCAYYGIQKVICRQESWRIFLSPDFES
jgi:hypothetical protein